MTDKLIVEKRGNIALLTMNNTTANTWKNGSASSMAEG